MTLDYLLANLAYKNVGCLLSFREFSLSIDNEDLVVFCDSLICIESVEFLGDFLITHFRIFPFQ